MSNDPPSKQEEKKIQSNENSTDSKVTNTKGEGNRVERLKKLHELTDYRMANEIPDD